ncbi:MAG: hypothetical protein BMS9Abin34_510 [Patescibacteria group bacterium]|nr:MAG: hypothetical protein BMS9Abin34_510 [Patescibacteria group bacterium]
MRIFDITHAYQPFEPPDFVPSWVADNLRQIFIPISRAMKEGVVKRHVQLQGWTIDAFLKAPDPIKSLAREFLDNLKVASDQGHIRLGFSGYSHPILPLLSDEVLIRSIKEDYSVIEEHLGKPTWFWFPEGACDRRSLEILFKEFPDVYAVIPDGSLGKQNFSGFLTLEGGGKVVVCNSVLKDIFMNALDYGKLQSYSPEGLSQEVAEKMVSDGKALADGLGYFAEGDAVLARDLENAGSKYGLFEFEKGSKELKSFYEGNSSVKFAFVEDGTFGGSLSLDAILPSSWEPLADEKNPYPYWNLPSWVDFGNVFCEVYKKDFLKQYLVVLASDVPWHILARKEWGPNPEHSQHFVRDVVMPVVRDIGEFDLIRAAEALLKDLNQFSPKPPGRGPHPSA